MSVLKKQIKTKKTKEEMKSFVNDKILKLPILSSVVSKSEWNIDRLDIESKLGDGYFLFMENLVELEIKLSFMGNIAKAQIEKAIDTEFLKLEENNS
ncbi:MAG: hypothetical protein FWG85_01125 [Bacteroidetes bacterium]|nr:hypothetical protein [Bacteroidota bacterium]